jgi:hypothetical protein
MDREIRTQACARPRALSWLCVLLILFAGFAQANHVHADKTSSTSHECSICSVAHAGAIVKVAYRAVPVFARSLLVVPQEVSPKPLLVASFLYIRPPPSV